MPEETPTVTTANGASWQEVAADRQRHRDATIAEVQPPLPAIPSPPDLPSNTTNIPASVLTAEELAITSANVEDLAPRLASGSLSATTVARAFLRRAALAQRLTNCVTELLPGRALARAAELDAHLAAHPGQPVGPLHGVPVSVKEHIGMAGLDLNGGFVGWVGRHVAEEDALLLRPLWDAGAVFYARTTQPQTLMHLETSSNLYGETVNPYNTSLTAGGSSGGEGALVGLRGSVLGIGSDIGGSIRSPAANCGVFGFKPTAGRLPLTGWAPLLSAAEHIVPTNGPLSTSLKGLELFMRVSLNGNGDGDGNGNDGVGAGSGKPWLREPNLVAMPWRDPASYFAADAREGGERRKLKVAVMWDDGVVKPHPPIAKALKDVVEKLKASENIEVVDWKPWRHDWAWEIIASLYFADGGQEELAAMGLSGEPLRPLTKWILTENPHVREHTIRSLWDAILARQEYRARYAALWNATASREDGEPVDVILCPAGPGVAPKLDTARYWGYTSQWNLLDYPALVFPVGDRRVGAGVEQGEYGGGDPEESVGPLSESDAYNSALWKEHGAEGYRDAPISLQLVGRRFDDEKLFRAAEIVLGEAGLPTTC